MLRLQALAHSSAQPANGDRNSEGSARPNGRYPVALARFESSADRNQRWFRGRFVCFASRAATSFYIVEITTDNPAPLNYSLVLSADFFSSGVDVGGYIGPGVTGFGDGNVITANGLSPFAFAAEIFRNVAPDRTDDTAKYEALYSRGLFDD